MEPVSNSRPKRENRGALLAQLLEQGLDSEDERVLREHSEQSSDATFTLSSDATSSDEYDSDFSDEEVQGVLEGEAVETEATVAREEREARRAAREAKLARSRRAFASARPSKSVKRRRPSEEPAEPNQPPAKHTRRDAEGGSSDSDTDGSSSSGDEVSNALGLKEKHHVLRLRPAPTIPHAQRMEEARQRAQRAREAERDGIGKEDLIALQAASQLRRRLRQRAQAHAHTAEAAVNAGSSASGDGARRGRLSDVSAVGDNRRTLEVLRWRAAQFYRENVFSEDDSTGQPSQLVGYHSGRSILAAYGVPTVVSFATALPAVLRND